MMYIGNLIDTLVVFQTAIVGLIGFGGVIATLIANARLARNRQRRAVEHDRAVLRGALASELQNIRESFVDRIRTLQEAASQQSDLTFPESPMTDIYDVSLARLGLLSNREREKTISTYLQIKEVPRKVMHLGRSGALPGHIFVATNYAKVIAEMHQMILPIIDEAIALLDPIAAGSFARTPANDERSTNRHQV